MEKDGKKKHGRYWIWQIETVPCFCYVLYRKRFRCSHEWDSPRFYNYSLFCFIFFLSWLGPAWFESHVRRCPYTSCELWMTPFGARIRVADSFRFFDIQEIVGIHSLWQLTPNTVLLTGSCLPLSGLAHVRPDLLSTAGCVANKFFGGFSFTFVVRVFSNFYMYLQNAC